MKAQEYIENQLKELQNFQPKEIAKEGLADEIFRLLMSKKFRKYAAKPELVEQIKNAITINVDKGQPINLTFLHGSYKLWRLQEAPDPDWGELFAAMYYTKWVKPVCEIYKPGVWFDYFVDDLIVARIDNIPLENIEKYIVEYQKILDFLKPYQPKNLKMTITRVGDQFASHDAFQKAVDTNIEKLLLTNPKFSERQLEMVELNAKPTPEQLKDPEWREKVSIIHDAYMTTKRETGYHYRPEKILVFNQPLPSGMLLAVGTTKTSIAKFWVGVGVLKRDGENFKEYILSPNQLKAAEFEWENVAIVGLNGKNFTKIRVIE